MPEVGCCMVGDTIEATVRHMKSKEVDHGWVLVFEAFDRNSHAASEAIRPSIITMGYVWAAAIASAAALLKKPGA